MKTKTKTRRRLVALLLAALMCIMSVPMLAVSAYAAEDDMLEIIDKDGTSQGTYLSFKAAIDAANDKKLDNYTLKLLKDVTTDTQIDINTDKAVTWTLDGNGKTITNTTAGVTAIKFGGNVEAKVTIKNLNIASAQCAMLIDNGTYTIVNGTYTVTDTNSPAGSTNWATGVINCNPVDSRDGNTKIVNLTILGGTFMSRYLTKIEGAENKIQATIRNYSKENTKSTVNVYGGYFLSESKMTDASVLNDCVFFNCDEAAGEAVLNIYGGTIESKNAAFAITTLVSGETNIYNGVVLADIYNNRGGANVANNTGAININAKTGVFNYTHVIMSGGAAMFRNKGTINGETDTPNYAEPQTAPIASLESLGKDNKTYVPEMTTGVAMMLGTDKGAVKYETKVSAATIANIKALADENTELSYGTLITDANLDKVRYITEEALKANGCSYVDVKAKDAKELDTDNNLTFSAALEEIKEEFYATKFTAISYVEAVINGVTVRFYGVYNGKDNCMSLSDIAAAAIADVKDASEGEYTNLLDSGKYSKYTQEEVTKLNTFIK